MSKIEVDTVEPQSGTSLTLGASGDTITIPSGATLVNNGTASGFGDNLEWQSSIVTAATITVTANKGYWIDTTSNACTITLPASAAVGDTIIFTDYARKWGTNAVTINQNSLNFQGGTDNPVYDTDGQTVTIVYSGATQGWIPNSDDVVADEGTIPPYSVDFLVVAGGGSGGGLSGGGGGAGGFRTSTQSVSVGTVLTITVGDGGAARAANGPEDGNTGSNSSISGSGLTTITSAGGGYGTSHAGTSGGDGGSGGAGGGGGGTIPGGSGNTPSTSPSQGNNGGSGLYTTGRTGGGGGGANAVGANGNGATTCGNGGAGTASSITGSSVTYAGGGGGSQNGAGGTIGTGGAGGGGNGVGSGNGNAGTVNTGGGGGGASEGNTASGAGGKGVIILSIPTENYSGTTTGSPTEATSGSNKILTFTGDGSYTT